MCPPSGLYRVILGPNKKALLRGISRKDHDKLSF